MYKVGQEEVDAIAKVVLSKRYFRYQGKENKSVTDQLEKSFEEKFQVSHSLMVTSGTNALVCAMAAAGIGPGDEVIIPSFTFVATAIAVLQVGAIPRIINIDSTLSLDPIEFKKAINENTKAVIPVHMDGLACDMEAICTIAKESNVLVIEDAAQAVGGSYKAKRLGAIGDLGCLSFNVDKIISCGEGGALLTNDNSFYKKALCFHDSPCQFGETKKDVFEESDLCIGTSMRFDDIKAAMLNIQLSRLDEILLQLRKRKKLLISKLEGKNYQIIQGNCIEGDCSTSLHIKYEDPIQMVTKVKKLLGEKVVCLPITGRPAHVCWQWMEQINKRRFFHPDLDPFKWAESDMSYQKSDFLQSVEILSSTLKIYLDLEGTDEEFEKKADLIAGLL
ncbi:MAG: DegT/DnrJ/EryC1/StrS family aminotransferase [Bacteriovoracaceae bacterium]|nr:DegT/DnrJ/EryC1/StrS family aminotransferase [Bacteriovoracaceae bacterium]